MRRSFLPNHPVSRRRLLQALGLGGIGLGLPSLFPRSVRADAVGSVRRIVLFVTGHGTVPDRWRMRPQSQPDGDDWEFSLVDTAQDQWSPILAPLYGMRAKLLVLEGLANAAGRTGSLNEHELGHASCLTGRIPVEVPGSIGRADGPSIDQIIASQLTDPGPLRSLEYAVGGWPVCFDDDGNSIPYEQDVFAAYSRLFPDGPAAPGDLTDTTRIRQAQPSVLDLVAERYEAMMPRASGDDRRKLEQHRDLVRGLETQLDALANLQCDGPEAPQGLPEWGAANYPAAMADAYFDLVKVALSCGITRVITVRHEEMFNSTVDAPPGDLHNDFAHSVEQNATAKDVMTRYHIHQAESFRRLVEGLDAIPDGDGTLLDSTVCVWTNELATGGHDLIDIPLVVAGGSGYFELGRYVHWRKQASLASPWGGVEIGPPHNRFLVSLARAMGLEVDEIGATEVPADGGGSISTTGMLDRVAK